MNARTEPETLLATSAVLVALTPLIPVPFADDLAKRVLTRRLVRELATAHDLALPAADVAILADDARGDVLASVVKALALAPLRLLLPTTFMVLAGKKVVDLASESYHRGWLVDRAFAAGFCAPRGPHSAREVRAAIDVVVVGMPLANSPVTAALRAGFARSQASLKDAFSALRARLTQRAARAPAAPEVEATAVQTAAGPGLGRVVAELERALRAVPAAHWEELGRELDVRLGPLHAAPVEGAPHDQDHGGAQPKPSEPSS